MHPSVWLKSEPNKETSIRVKRLLQKSVKFYQTTRRHIPEDGDLHSYTFVLV
jgi:hypothetical protein